MSTPRPGQAYTLLAATGVVRDAQRSAPGACCRWREGDVDRATRARRHRAPTGVGLGEIAVRGDAGKTERRAAGVGECDRLRSARRPHRLAAEADARR